MKRSSLEINLLPALVFTLVFAFSVGLSAAFYNLENQSQQNLFTNTFDHKLQHSVYILAIGTSLALMMALLLRMVLRQNNRILDIAYAKTRRLEIARNEIQEAHLAKSRFLDNMSHELRTPLNLIIGITDLLELRAHDHDQLYLINKMRESGHHLLTMITDLIAISNQRKLTESIRSIPISIPTFFEEIIQFVSDDCRRKSLRLLLNIDHQVPARAIGDPARLRQILFNLLSNAIKYTNVGSVSLRIKAQPVGTLNNQALFILEVEDTGIGISPKNLNRVFDRFFQLEASRRMAEGGLGLGLTIARELVEKMSGKIELESRLGAGTRVTVKIPLEVETATIPWIERFTSVEKAPRTALCLSNNPNFAQTIGAILPKQFGQLIAKSFSDIENSDPLIVSQAFEYVVIDGSPPNGWKAIESMITNSRLIFIGNQVDLRNVTTPITIRSIEGSPLIPTQLLEAFSYFPTKNRSKVQSQTENHNFGLEPTAIRPLKLLIADDDQGNRDLLKAYFKDMPWDISFACDGIEALNHFVKAQPDLVIADLRMPSLDGFQLADRIRDHEKIHNKPKTKIIILTADSLEETRQQANNHEINLFLTKPIRRQPLIDSVSRCTQ